MNKINTKNNPKFLPLNSESNYQGAMMKQMERIEDRVDGIGVLILIHMVVVIMGIIGIMIVAQ